MEQTEECYEVEKERIEDAQLIFVDSEKKSDLSEYLSYLKAGVPMGIRVKFYKKFQKIVKEGLSKDLKNPKVEPLKEFFTLVEQRLGERLLQSLNLHEYFVHENMMKQIF